MAFDEHATEFARRPVRDYDPDEGIIDPEATCQRVGRAFRYGDPQGDLTFDALLGRFLADPAAGRVVGLVIGPWWDETYGREPTSEAVVAALVAARDRLPGLRAIFLGDITREENELTWIKHRDVTPLLEAFPALEHLKVRGSGASYRDPRGPGPALRPVGHAALRSLCFEAGCLPAAVTRAVAASRLPKLEHLELWLGDDLSSNCSGSGDTTVEDLAPIFAGAAFPSLKSLALRNSRISDEIAVALADAPLLRRLDVLDLSLGTLSDAGALALINSGALSGLKRLDIDFHYVSDEVLDGLKAVGIDLVARDHRENEDWDDEDEGGRYIAVGE